MKKRQNMESHKPADNSRILPEKTCIQISTENEIKNNPLYKVGRQKVPETIRILTQFICMYDEIFLNMYIIIK